MGEIRVFFAKSSDKSDVYRLLETAVQQVYGISMPTLQKDENGKPYFLDRGDIHFSLSHSGEYVMCAISDSPVGCDVQKYQEISDKVQKRIFTDKELEFSDPLSLWGLKESFIKLHGKLDREYKNMEFLKCEDVFRGPDNTFGVLINEIQGYAAAICAYNRDNVKVLML